MYVEFVLSAVNESIAESADSGQFPVSGFVKPVLGRASRDRALLRAFGLSETELGRAAYDNFDKYKYTLATIKKEYNTKLEELYAQRQAIRELRDILSSEGDAEVKARYAGIDGLDESILQTSIEAIRREYFIELMVHISEAYLRYQNKAEYVTFKVVEGHVASKSQGSEVIGLR